MTPPQCRNSGEHYRQRRTMLGRRQRSYRRNSWCGLELVFEGEKLTEVAEGEARDLSADIADTQAGRTLARADADKYRKLVNDTRHRDPDRPEHHLQDVVDAYRWRHPDAARAVPHGVGFSRPGR